MLETYNRQRIFTKVVTSLRKQGAQAVNPDGQCRYRQPAVPEATTRCGIGHVIKDEFYFTGLEGHGCTQEAVVFALKQSGWDVSVKMNSVDDLRDPTSDLYFLDKIQSAHDRKPEDGKTQMETWEEKWAEIADKFGLELPARE